MNVDVTDAFAVQSAGLYVAEHLIGFRNECHRQMLQQIQGQCAIGQVAAGNLAHDKWMHNDRITFKQVDKPLLAPVEMVDPHRCVD